MPVPRQDILAAAARIEGRVRRTPVVALEAGAFGLDAPVTLKLELLQRTGSFKLRGACNRMLAGDVPAEGVIAASGGNFGIATAYAARSLSHRAEVFVPDTSPAVKVDRLRELGADVRLVPGYYADALEASTRRAAETGALFLHAYDQPEVVAGAGTIGIELDEQAPDADTIVVPVGGGGLIAGIASWAAGTRRVVGVEPEACPTLSAALSAGEPVDVEVGGVAADSLGSRRAGRIAVETAGRFVERVALVTDDAIREAQRALWGEVRVVAEPGGAAGLAALLSGAYRPEPGERLVVVISGANTDPAAVTR